MKTRELVANSALFVVSLFAGVVLCEIGARFLVNTADYLSVETVQDPILGIAIAPASRGFDEWGFRNKGVPSAADVVALGDSHTFGNTARMEDAWPAVVSGIRQAQVYNLGVGGYGPNQYDWLMKNRALKLHPRWVLCGLYMGDDFENAFSVTYGLDHWASLRAGQWSPVDANIWDAIEPPGTFKGLRNWLSRESLTYQLVVHGPVLGWLKERVQFQDAVQGTDPFTTTLRVDDKNIREAFRPLGLARRLDQNSREVQEGMRITFQLLKDMNAMCRDNDCRFGVVIIPTKETVFADYLEQQPQLHLKESVDALIRNERAARNELGDFLAATGIPYVDTLPGLKAAVGDQLYARTTRDMHPGKNGYKIIGEQVARFLSQQPSSVSQLR